MDYATFSLETAAFESGLSFVAGMDEVGRGCIAGPVVAAIAVFSQEHQFIAGVRDSKMISPGKRATLCEQILSVVDDYGVGEVNAEDIDEIGIASATVRAMRKAYESLSQRPDVVFVDGKWITTPSIRRIRIAGGDRKHYSISAASIIAKVYRDRLMHAYARGFPGYGFERHVGYGTRDHLDAVARFGVTALHRKSFSPISRMSNYRRYVR